MRDRRILLTTACLRAFATGLMGVLLGLYLAHLNFNAGEIGVVVGVGLTGAALSSLVVTFLGDRLGRRSSLLVLVALAAGGGVVLWWTTHLLAVCAAAFFGMVNGAGRDRGAALVLEQAMLPQTTDDAHRTRSFAWYNVLQDAGHALGVLAAGLPALMGNGALFGYQVAIGVYVALYALTGLLYLGLSAAVEPAAPSPRWIPPVSPESRRIIARVAGLFAIDSFAGGFLGTALLSYFFFVRFGVGEGAIALLFFAARIANGVSHLGAAWLAARIGLVNTMVFTHVPSSLVLIAVALVPQFWMAALLFLVRELLVEMDVPTRQSYVMAVVKPEERTFASGVTSLVRLAGWAIGPFAAGVLMQGVALTMPLIVGAGLKIGYDLMLYRSFRDLKPPEERQGD
ncbi:MAG: MFS transporter [Burkholderiales bacterium]|nr:MFS transporter [Burkholderiales bacterium]